MKGQHYFYWLFLVFTIIQSCGSILPKQPSITTETILAFPSTKGTVRIPVEIDLNPYFDLADKSIAKTFQGKSEQCDGISFQYYFKRKPLKFVGFNRTLHYTINGEYNLRANYCAQCSSVFGSDPFCLTPRIYVSCGVGEPLRNIVVDFESELNIEDNFLLKSKTKLVNLHTIDPCEFTFMKYDASKLIEKEMSSYLGEIESEIDIQIGAIDLKTPVEEAWKVMQKPLPIQGMGFLYFQPSAIGIEPISFTNNKANLVINMELSPIFSTDTIVTSKQRLPFLSKIKTHENFNLPLQTLASYDSINALLSKEVIGIQIPFKKKQIRIIDAKVLGPVGKQLLFKVQFTGNKKGILYLLGTPTFDSTTKEISFPDLTFDLETKDAVLKSAQWLFDNKLTESLRSKAKFDLTNQLEKARLEIDKQLNTSIEYNKNQYVQLHGNMSKLNFSNVQIGAKELHITIDLEGKLSLHL